MTRFRIVAVALLGVLAAWALPAPAQTAPWRNVGGSLRQITEIAAIEQFARDHPYSSNVHLALLNVYLEAGRMDAAWQEIEFLATRGYVFSEAGRAGLLASFDGPLRDRLQALLAAGPEPLAASETFATVPAEAELVESLAWDESRQLLFVSTVVSRALFRRDSDGRWERIALAGTGSLGGLAFDPARGRLWIASGVYDETPDPATAFRGLIGYAPDSGDTVRIAGPAAGSPGDIAVGEDGTLYASDPLNGAIYRAAGGALETWVAPGTFRSPQGLVPWEGGAIVSDYGYGLAFVDPAGKAWRIDSDAPALLDGIDGMWRRGQTIVAVQNGARPARIVELTMAPDGRRITAVRELERAHPTWTEPLGAAIVGDSLAYVATGQWASFGEGGRLREGAAARPTELRLLPLGESPASSR